MRPHRPCATEAVCGADLGYQRRGRGRGDDPAFGVACDAASSLSAPYERSRLIRLTPQRVARFLEELGRPCTTVVAAAAAIGVSSAATYQRRGHDRAFAQAMDAARKAARKAGQ
jgi:hypothetical protein